MTTSHRTRFHRNAMALAALVLAQGLAQATVSEDDLKKVKVYGNVTVAQDSVSKWGPWEEFEAPAAGPTQLSGIPVTVRDVYRPLPDVPVDGLCAGGSLCGFGAFSTYETGFESYLREGEGEGKGQPELHPAVLTGRILAGPQTREAMEQDFALSEGPSAPIFVVPTDPYSVMPSQVGYTAKPLSTGTLVFPDSGTLTLDYAWSYYDGYMYGRYYRNEETDTQGTYIYANVNTAPDLGDPAETQVVLFSTYGSMYNYINGNGSVAMDGGYSGSGERMVGVIGYTTSDADMSALRASNATAVYRGFTLNEGSVEINVNFGNSTWNGNWGGQPGGRDGAYVGAERSNTGSMMLYGQIGFEAEGVIKGVNLTSTSVRSADAASISGSVKGAFYGTNAAAVGGVVDITKTRVVPAATAANSEQAGYSGRLVTPFVASKNWNANNDR